MASSVFEEAQESLRSHILAHDLGVGDPLPPTAELAQQFGVSVPSLREALRALEAAGVLDIRHGVGTFLKAYDYAPILRNLSFSTLFAREPAIQMLRARQALEMGALHQAVDKLTPEDLDRLDALTEEMASPEEELPAEYRFHLQLIVSLDNHLLQEMWRFLWLAWRQEAERHHTGALGGRLRYALHIEMVEALRRRDVSAAQEALARYYERLEAELADSMA